MKKKPEDTSYGTLYSEEYVRQSNLENKILLGILGLLVLVIVICSIMEIISNAG